MESESKRPPWRAVSLSTLPKPDKNALLRAKLLDASRRLRAGKTSIGIQSDLTPTKLVKDVNLGTQIDLILYKDVGILTDGFYVKKKSESSEYILTYSISQMTDSVKYRNVATQTLLPRAFNKKYNEIKNTLSNGKRITDKFPEDDAVNESSPRRNLFQPTLASWHFEYDEENIIDSDNNFLPYTIEARKPWASFIPFPFKMGESSVIGNLEVDWLKFIYIIDELIYESNCLMDKIDTIIENKKSNPEEKASMFNSIQTVELENYSPLSNHWIPIIEKLENELEILVKSDK